MREFEEIRRSVPLLRRCLSLLRPAVEGAFGALLPDGPQRTLRTCPGRRRFSAIRVFLRKSVSYGAFVWARRARKHQKRRFPTPRAAACLVHDLVTTVKCY
jgi:hypothetical protein